MCPSRAEGFFRFRGIGRGRPRRGTPARGTTRAAQNTRSRKGHGVSGTTVTPSDVAGSVSRATTNRARTTMTGAQSLVRSLEQVGVCMATSGPGATNLVTPIADAYMDSVPMVAITGQVASTSIGTDAFQEADIRGITMPITKHNYLVTDAAQIPRAIAEAFHIAGTGRPGPVLVDISKDALQATTEFVWPDKVELAGYHPVTKPHGKQVREAAKLIVESHRPVLYIGGGVIRAQASEELRRLVDLTNIPSVTTLMARGALPDSHPANLGMPGMHGTVAAVTALQRSDLIVSLGARFDDRVTGQLSTFAPHAKIVHADIDPAEIGKNRVTDVPIVGDAMPAAMGAKAGMPDRTVWAIDGDGCFQMTNQELATCVINEIPIKVAVINNSSLGMVRQWQTLFYGERYSNTDLHTGSARRIPDFVKLADAYGCVGLRCERPENLDATIEAAMAVNDRPVVVDFVVHRDAMVWPMVAAGLSNDKIQFARGMSPTWDREE